MAVCPGETPATENLKKGNIPMTDLIANSAVVPTSGEIDAYINEPVRSLWLELNGFIQERNKSAPKIQFSICAGKPGWNVKYQKSGKSICTLYPEKNCFVALVVIKLELAAMVEKAEPAFHPMIVDMVKNSKPFNNTLWLMITVDNRSVLESVMDLIVLKMEIK
jgi:hypothetical protein